MALSVRHVGTRVLLILALVAALLAGTVAVYWATGQSSSSHGVVKTCGSAATCIKTGSLGGDSGGGKFRTAKLGGDAGGGHIRTVSRAPGGAPHGPNCSSGSGEC
jgi:hypothetical protein